MNVTTEMMQKKQISIITATIKAMKQYNERVPQQRAKK
jgi:hypothetical protein